MQYTKADERAPVTPIRSATGPDYRHNSDIRRTRTILLILLIIQTVRTHRSFHLPLNIPFDF